PESVRRRAAGLMIAGTSAALLTGCAPVVALESAPDAANPACANVTVRLPDVLGDLVRRETNAQATGAWGDPTGVVLHCGVDVPGPSTFECREFDGVEWLIDDTNADAVVATTFGRDPAVGVAIDMSIPAPGVLLADLAPAIVSAGPAEASCL
ncbi:MAG: DUF3515 family protein, partial [Microbacteriaceae bacterium]|nr:DUF3515 family protein [Microbacteriaceae bacterium]